jgi:AAA15 family ATPase/GTPase
MSNSGLGIHIHRIEGNVPACGFLYARNQPNPRDDANFFGQLATINAEDKILKFVKIVEPNLIGLTTIAFGNNSVLHGDIGIGRKIPIYHMGDGVVRAVHLVLFIAACRGGVVLIDELGNGIHYSILSSVIEAVAAAAKEFDVQIFATTHSAELIREAHGGMAEEHAKELTYIRLDRSKDVVVAKTYDHETLAAAIENEWEVR